MSAETSRRARHSSASNDHGSPPNLIEVARRTMGSIDLDPASSAVFNRAVRARRFFSVENNGLAQAWSGNVWLNPPGGVDPETRDSRQAIWWWSLARRWQGGHVAQACFVGFSVEVLQVAQADDDEVPPAFRLPSPLQFPFCVPRSRPKYWKPVEEGGKTTLVEQGSPSHAGVLVYLPPRANLTEWQDRFVANCAGVGEVANLRTAETLGRPVMSKP